ncbi:hypothetical protein A9P82_06975 [Arachidicoccus ginsenosidimutans]|uniref:hypothetical protein n=1 Tax=Arachidicoccus sp. BS20 TaxID=1850526 RepID=UPI0007F1713E|nr:hypothetical protein [Arachidicoccus sp. BS20]ANI89053.1 hypothetical protein A9P82_06975 [Arachidicoccus sp. BS20]
MKKIACFYLIIIAMSCHKKKIEKWDTVIIDNTLSRNDVYKKMDKEKEIFSWDENMQNSKRQDSLLAKKSSDVKLFEGSPNEFIETLFNASGVAGYASYNNCRAYLQSDTVIINIGISSMFTGHNISIRYTNKAFSVKGEDWSDVIMPCKETTYDSTIFHKLILDKSIYKLGDSLYGFIDFKSIQTNDCKDTLLFRANGFFRTKILLPKE